MRIVRLCVALGLLSLIAPAQNPVRLTTSPRDTARPIAALLDEMRKSTRIAVTYEDPRYSKRSDMDERPSEFSYLPEELHTLEGAETTIARMLREYGASGGLTFTVIRKGLRLHVMPSETVDAAGQRVRQDSILDTIITIPPGRRDGAQLLEKICDEIEKQTGYEVAVGPSAPDVSLVRYKTTEGIESQSARAAIEHLFDHAMQPGSFVWDMYYDPAAREYGLNFAYVGPAAGPGHTAK
jgi:hypothetical protein